MQEETQTQPIQNNPLLKEVAGHLFTFEEKIFGMSLTQLLTDLGVLTGTFSLTGSLPLLPRLIVSLLVTLTAMILVHAKIQGLALLSWLSLIVRAKTIPTHTIWQPRKRSQTKRGPGNKRLPSIQEHWIPIDTLHHGTGCKIDQQKKGETVHSWTALEIDRATQARRDIPMSYYRNNGIVPFKVPMVDAVKQRLNSVSLYQK